MSVYSGGSSTPTQWTSAGCYVDASTRMLRGSSSNINGLTTEMCINLCSASGYTMAATEYGKECYCGSQLYKEGGAGVVADPSTCNVACGGNLAQSRPYSFS
jgi:glucan endo-1,3-alpha-glucosidase